MQKNIYSPNQKKLQEVLRKLRTESSYRQKDLADLLGVHQSFVSKYESGERRLDILELREICGIFKITLSEFVCKLEEVLDEA